MNVVLHIERLIIDGLDIDPRQGRRLQAAIEQELVALLSGQQGRSVTAERSGPLSGSTGPLQIGSLRPEQLGPQIAAAVMGRIDVLSSGDRHE
ncbi:hypothetical protein [Chitinimonas sp.]|uniref:hypothetical protein n=1 Tax=Chitinimonas sp. TaxID=1934313 RepID=UPI002F934612